jgi:hypothetical protein
MFTKTKRSAIWDLRKKLFSKLDYLEKYRSEFVEDLGSG